MHGAQRQRCGLISQNLEFLPPGKSVAMEVWGLVPCEGTPKFEESNLESYLRPRLLTRESLLISLLNPLISKIQPKAAMEGKFQMK
jgi:hypothetical protein